MALIEVKAIVLRAEEENRWFPTPNADTCPRCFSADIHVSGPWYYFTSEIRPEPFGSVPERTWPHVTRHVSHESYTAECNNCTARWPPNKQATRIILEREEMVRWYDSRREW